MASSNDMLGLPHAVRNKVVIDNIHKMIVDFCIFAETLCKVDKFYVIICI